MLTAADLDAYFTRIGYGGRAEPSLETLNALTAAHTQSIPFENLDVLLGRAISLEPEDLLRKLVHERRGGYCFEQNGLFLAVLTALGFQVAPLSARVRWQRPRSETPPRTHVLLRVELDGASWLTDVGVGGLSLTGVLALAREDEQATPHEPRRLLREGARIFHQVRLNDDWHDVCELTLEEMPAVDRKLANFYTSEHPESHFKNRLLVARAAPAGRRVSLLNDELSMRSADGRAEKQQVASAEALLAILEQHFGLRFAAGTRFGAWPFAQA